MNISVLKNFGLHHNDILVYETLLRLGKTKSGPLIRKSEVVSSRVYEALALLQEKGLVSYEVKNNIRYYRAESPTLLLEANEQHRQELEKLAVEIDTVIVDIPSRNTVNVYEKRHGFRMAFLQHVENLNDKEEISVIAFGPKYGNSRELRTLFNNLDRSMVAKKCLSKILLDKKLRPIMEKDRAHLEIYNIRYLPSEYFSPMATNISHNEVLISVWGNEPVALSIKNPTVIKSFQNNFDLMWNKAKK